MVTFKVGKGDGAYQQWWHLRWMVKLSRLTQESIFQIRDISDVLSSTETWCL